MSQPGGTPNVVTFSGALTLENAPTIDAAMNGLRDGTAAVIVDMAAVTSVEPMVAMDLLIVLRKRLRHGKRTAVVVPATGADWLTGAQSLSDMTFHRTLAEALAAAAG